MVKGSQGGAVIAVWGGSDITLQASESVDTYFRCIWLPNVSSSLFSTEIEKSPVTFDRAKFQRVKVNHVPCRSSLDASRT